MRRWRHALVWLAVCAAVSCGRTVDPEAFSRALGPALARQAADDPDRVVAAAVRAFYAARHNEPAWIDRSSLKEATATLSTAETYGLPPTGNADAIATAFDALGKRDGPRADAAAWAALDVRISAALLRLGRDVALGSVPASVVGAEWPPRLTADALAASLADAWEHGTVASWLTRLEPTHEGYRKLKAALAHLQASGSSDDTRLAIVRANLDRWRWLPADLGDRRLVVNIPEFLLRAEEGAQHIFDMRVIVGAPDDRRTPLFSDAMETVVFNPYWNIPRSIAIKETLPAIAKDPDYFARHDIEVLDASAGHRPVDPEAVDWSDPDAVKSLVLRQRPGDGNALGDVKFLFPNRHAVYMHDTPSQAFFGRTMRALSHGCVRVAEPGKLAAYVLGDQRAWDSEAIASTMAGDEERHVKLTKPLPVHLVYFTAVVDPSGRLVFLDDIYRIDQKQLQARPRGTV